MTRRANGRAEKPWRSPTRTFVFFRAEGWYYVDLPENEVVSVVEINPGTLKVEDMRGNVVWRPN